MKKKIGNETAAVDRRTFLTGTAATMAALSITIPADKARAAGYPERAITLVVMYGAGGGTDTIMRKLAEEMAKSKGWKINVINKPGAVGGVATQYVHGQASDGYTVLGGANYNKFVRVMGHVDFVPWEEWVFFQAATANASWSVTPDSPFKTFDDVVAAAKANPGKITISTSGTGGLWHELALIVGSFADVSLKYVPYKGGKAATLADCRVKSISPAAACTSMSTWCVPASCAACSRLPPPTSPWKTERSCPQSAACSHPSSPSCRSAAPTTSS